MIGPIANDKITSQQSEKSSAGKSQTDSDATQIVDESTPQTRASEDTVNVSAGGQILSQGTTAAQSASDSVDTYQQASDLAAKVRQQLELGGQNALLLYSGDGHAKAGELLNASPA